MRAHLQPGHRDPAPGNLALVQAFLNSVDLEDGPDAFATIDGLRTWLVAHGFTESDLDMVAADRERAIAVREALRDLLAAHNGELVPADAGARLDAALTGVTVRFRIGDGIAPHLDAEGAGLLHVLGCLMTIVHEAQIAGTWQRLKTCRNDVCRWAFYDASKNRSGSWCTMAICGNKAKARDYRRRRG